MPSGIEVFDANGKLIMDGAGRYPRIVEVIDLNAVGTPGSKVYPELDPASLQVVVFQGGGRARYAGVSGQTVSWGFATGFYYRAFSGAPKIVVISG